MKLSARHGACPLALVALVASLWLSSAANAMEALKPSRYFADPAVAAFVGDVQRGNAARVKTGLAAGILPNAQGIDGFRPIHFVFVALKADVLRELLGAGADPNARLFNGNTPLHFAVRMPNPDFTSALLAAKADPDARGDNDKPVIFVATAYSGNGALEQLKRAGADLNAIWAGKTPLIDAVAGTSWRSAAELLGLGADISIRDRRGETAADWWCGQLKGQPVVEKCRGDVLALADAFAARGVTLACAAEVQRFR